MTGARRGDVSSAQFGLAGEQSISPGYFTGIKGRFVQPAGTIVFAGEHTDSFYSYQGFREGALLSGARAADQVLRLA